MANREFDIPLPESIRKQRQKPVYLMVAYNVMNDEYITAKEGINRVLDAAG